MLYLMSLSQKALPLHGLCGIWQTEHSIVRIGMAKYNINIEDNKKIAAYRSKVDPMQIRELKVKIAGIIKRKKRYRDTGYSVMRLAEELGVDARYISAAMKIGFGMNYTSFVNKCRVDAALLLLRDKRYENLKMEEIGNMVGFLNRQSFYASFYKFTGMSPKQYKQAHEAEPVV